MRLFAWGKWLPEQKRWSVVIPMPERPGKESVEDGETRKEPLKKDRAHVLRFRKRTKR